MKCSKANMARIKRRFEEAYMFGLKTRYDELYEFVLMGGFAEDEGDLQREFEELEFAIEKLCKKLNYEWDLKRNELLRRG